MYHRCWLIRALTIAIVFTKLASQLSSAKLSDLAIIPAIFVVQTLVSWIVAKIVARLFRFNRRASNFVTAMGVFGNSNSLPISLVISLSQTLKGLHWDRIPGDNDNEVGARGILYLLIFQQLGQLVRWSWGYHVLLAPKDKYLEYQDHIAEEGQYRDTVEHDDNEARPLMDGLDGDTEDDNDTSTIDSRIYEPAGRTPVAVASSSSLVDMVGEDGSPNKRIQAGMKSALNNNQTFNGSGTDILFFPRPPTEDEPEAPEVGGRFQRKWLEAKLSTKNKLKSWKTRSADGLSRLYERLPRPIQAVLSFLKLAGAKTNRFIWDFMNPPLWAMLIAVLVASVPSLQRLFFQEGSFVKNSVTDAIESSAGVAVPLILVVLGANLARNTTARDGIQDDPEEEQLGNKLLIAALISRMILPTAIMAPILALMAKYLAISILDDPIFVIVCFLLSGAPSALQLAQICQINNVYEKTMGKILFQSYVVW